MENCQVEKSIYFRDKINKMPLLPTLKQQKRYIVFQIISNKKFLMEEVKEEVEISLQNFLGQLGLAKSSPIFIKEKFNYDAQKFILKINHNFTDELKAALTLIKKIKNTSVIIISLTTSGTLKKASVYLK